MKCVCNLQVLNLPGNNLSKVSPTVFGLAISKLRTANLSDTAISADMFNNLFHVMANETRDMKLCHLNIAHNSALKHVDPDLLSEAIIKLESVNMNMTSATATQISSLIKLSSTQDYPRLREVNMSGVSALSKVDHLLLSSFVLSLSSATLYSTKLSPTQLIAILTRIINTNQPLTLHHLDLGGSNFSSLSPSLISSAVNKIPSVTLFFTKLTTNQQVEILQQACSQSRLECLDISGNLRNIPPSLLSEAKNNIRDLVFDA